MENTTRDPLVDLERHRLRLEENVAKLRKSLQHWQTWDLEYEGLKEEIQRFKGQPTTEDIVDIGKHFGGDLVNEKEIKELLGFGKTIQRNASQVVDLISRRLDYVRQNTQTVQKQLDAAEKKLQAALVLLEPDLDDEEGLPLTDIQEELDEEGNVISSTLSHPSKTAPSIMNTLRKAGVTGFEETQAIEEKPLDQPTLQTVDSISVTENKTPAKLDGKYLLHPVASSGPSSSASASPLRFPGETRALSAKANQDTAKPAKLDGLMSSGFNNDLAAFTFNRGNRVIEIDENDNEIASYPVIPADESPEDAALRREMLQYGLSEVGAVVAEIDLGTGSEFSDSDEDEESEYAVTDDEEEDEYGRSTRRVLTDDYRNEMLALEKRLNARMLENLGPQPESNPLTEHAEDVRRLIVRKEPAGLDKTVPKLDEKKKAVRFAEELDISPAPSTHDTNIQHTKVTQVPNSSLKEVIIERSTSSDEHRITSSGQSKTNKVSRFKNSRVASASSKAARTECAAAGTVNELCSTLSNPNPHGEGSNQPQYTPEGPPGKTLASNIVERPITENITPPPDNSGLDPITLKQEIAVEYHKMRNRFIQKQGGFTPSEIETEDPLMEEINGKTKRVSRFKAARLKPLDS